MALHCALSSNIGLLFGFLLQPLPDTQYNGNPESVGYRIKFWRMDLQPSALLKVISDRLERECTIEDLEEWTEYELQIQAFNAIGAGPWSEVVRGRTRESGESEPRVGWEGQTQECSACDAFFLFSCFSCWPIKSKTRKMNDLLVH